MEMFENPQIKWEHLPKLGAVRYDALATNYKWVAMVRSLIGSAFLFLLCLMVAIFFRLWSWEYWMWVLIGFSLWVPFSLFRAYMVYKSKGYALRDKDIVYRSGWLWKRVVSVPFNRIQHVELKRGPIEELLYLRTLHIYTAGGSSADLAFSGLSPEQAEGLQTFIVTKTGLNEEE